MDCVYFMSAEHGASGESLEATLLKRKRPHMYNQIDVNSSILGSEQMGMVVCSPLYVHAPQKS